MIYAGMNSSSFEEFDKVTFTGLSLIATGHSHADVMMGYMPYEYYRLWLWTGDEHYLEFCRFLNGNTKQTTDWNRKLVDVSAGFSPILANFLEEVLMKCVDQLVAE